MILLRGYKYKLQPTRAQAERLGQWLGACRSLYNVALDQRSWAWEQRKESTSYVKQAAELPNLKAEFDWIKDVPAATLQHTLRDLDGAFKKFFKGQAEYPKPKKKFRNSCGIRFPVAPKIEQESSNKKGYVTLPKIGTITYRKSRLIPGEVELRSATITRDATGFYISILVREELPDPTAPLGAVGIDRGVAHTLACSDDLGASFFRDLPTSIKAVEKTIARLQQKLALKKRFSNNWKRLKNKISRLHSRIARIRRDFLQKNATDLTKNHGLVVIEKLQTSNMSKSASGTKENPGKNVAQKKGLNRSILRQGWYMFETMLRQKATEYGGHVEACNPRNTSRECAECEYTTKDNRKTQDAFCCIQCGHEEHADINASKNILARGQRDNQNALRTLSA